MIDIFDDRQYIESFCKIKTKKGEIVPLKLNPAQEKLQGIIDKLEREGKPIRLIILKARQLGFSTYIEAQMVKRCCTQRNRNGLVVAHREDATANLFKMTKLYVDELPKPARPMVKASNAQELIFENPTRNARERAMEPGLRSRIRCVTAGGKGIGRSDTLHFVHCSEYAFWPDGIYGKASTLLGILQAVPAEAGTVVVIESTANGFDDFKAMWDKAVAGENDFVPCFFAWYEDPGYKMPVPPGTEWTEEERELQERFGLRGEQLAWRRWCIANNCGGDERKFLQEYPSSPEEAFLHSGNAVFDNGLVSRQLEKCPKPETRGEFRVIDTPGIPEVDGSGAPIPGHWQREPEHSYEWREKESGAIKLYEFPQERVPYVIGADTAGEGSDWFTAVCIDNTTGKIVATLRQQTDEPSFVRQLWALGCYYNNALLGPEVNFSTYPLQTLRNTYAYGNLFIRAAGADEISGKLSGKFGFRTDSATRPRIIAQMVEVFSEHPDWFTSPELLREMLSFVYNENHRPEAMIGEHDDMVMAAAITYDIRGQQSYTKFAKAEPKRELSPLAKMAKKARKGR